jgi:hypothetical protein
MLGNTTSGPRYVCASRCNSSGAPPGSTRAVPCTTRYSSKPHSLTVVDGTERAIRGSRRRFLSFRWSGSVATTISLSSTPTQASEICGPPSSSIVTTCATALLSSSCRAESGSAMPRRDGGSMVVVATALAGLPDAPLVVLAKLHLRRRALERIPTTQRSPRSMSSKKLLQVAPHRRCDRTSRSMRPVNEAGDAKGV